MRTVQQMASDSAWPLVVILAAVFFITLVPVSGPAELVSGVCLICGPYGTADFVLNVLLFVPLGFVVTNRVNHAGRVMALVVLLTVGIELVQFVVPGRHPTLGDIAANSVGGGIGIWIATGRFLRPFGQVLPYALAVMLMGTVWAYEPSVPDSAYVGQWTPALSSFDQYGGRITRARIGNIDLPDGLLQGAVHDSVHSAPGGTPITVEFIAGPATRRIAPMLRVSDQHEREILLIGSQGSAIVVRMRRLAQRFGLHGPQTRFVDAHPPAGTESIVRFERRGRQFCVGTPKTAACRSSANPARGWFLLTGLSLPRWASSLADALWLSGLGILLVLGRRRAVQWLPTLAYVALWIILQGDLAWAPGFLGILLASAGVSVVQRS